MALYDNTKCPVCGELFKDGDDIVTCPICGTPHHRECYKSLGTCANAKMHSDGYSFKKGTEESTLNNDENAITAEKQTEIQQEQKEIKQQPNSYYTPFSNDSNEDNSDKKENSEYENKNTFTCSECGAEIEKGTPFCPKCGARQSETSYGSYKPPVDFNAPPVEKSKYQESSEKIDGVALSDVATFVRINPDKFLPKFIKNKKISWNWSGFIFGPYYLFYRKMHLQGVMFMAVNLIIDLLVSTFYSDKIMALYQLMEKALSSQDVNAMASVATSGEYMAALPAMLITVIGALVLHIIIGLCVNSIYRKKVITTIKQIDEKLNDEQMVGLSQMMGVENEINGPDARKMYILRQGGVNAFAPLLAYFLLNIVTSIISTL